MAKEQMKLNICSFCNSYKLISYTLCLLCDIKYATKKARNTCSGLHALRAFRLPYT